MTEEEISRHTVGISEGIVRYLISGIDALQEKFKAEYENGDLPKIDYVSHMDNIDKVFAFLQTLIDMGVRDGVIKEEEESDA